MTSSGDHFLTTRWTHVLAAQGVSTRAGTALADLRAAYYAPDEFIGLTPQFGVADRHQTDAKLIMWMKEHRMDAIGRVVLADGKVTQLGLRTFELLTIPAAADAWEKLTAVQISEQIESVSPRQSPRRASNCVYRRNCGRM